LVLVGLQADSVPLLKHQKGGEFHGITIVAPGAVACRRSQTTKW
jgi:hypothetical protein